MRNYFISLVVVIFTVLFSGCELAGKANGGIYKSTDGGQTFEMKNQISSKFNLATQSVYDIELDFSGNNKMYIGTSQGGILLSEDGGETWLRDLNGFVEVKNIEIKPTDPNTIFISAIKDGRSKVLKTENGGEQWREVYTEKDSQSVVTSLEINENRPDTLFLGNSKGGIFRSENGGDTWEALHWVAGSIVKIAIDNVNPDLIYVATTSNGLLSSKDGGATFSEIVKKSKAYNIVTHPNREGAVFLSDAQGLQVSNDSGTSWKVINTLVNPKELGSLGLAINPNNDQEIFYSSSQAVYKSVDGGVSWKPIQLNISGKTVDAIAIDRNNDKNIYLGMVKIKSSGGILK